MSRGRTRGWLTLLLVGLALGYAALGLWITTEQGRAALGRLGPYLPWLYFLQHVAMFLALAWWFGGSLRPGRQALVTRFALLEGPLSPAGRAYTRSVTLAWAVFGAAVAVTSALLYFLAPLAVWSLFANLLTLPLVGSMFVAEFLVRIRACPERSHGGMLRSVVRSVRAFWASGARPSAGPR